jgi:hypothetical protein
MDRLDRSIGIYTMALNDSRVEPDRDTNAENQALRALVLLVIPSQRSNHRKQAF